MKLPTEQEFKDRNAELAVCLQLLKKVLSETSYMTDDGDVILEVRGKAPDVYQRAWNFVYNTFDKDDYLDLL